MENYSKAQMDALSDEILSEFNHVKGNRGNWESHWTEIAERFIPSQSQQFKSKGSNSSNGSKNTEFIFDSTPTIALNRFAAILDSMLTPRNSTWHKLGASNPLIAKDRQAQIWFEEATRLLFKYRYAPEANFASQNQQVWKSIGAFGSGAMFTDDLIGGKGLRYKSIHLSEIYFVENHQGTVDKNLRHFPLTARQAYQKWGDKCPEAVINSIKTAPDKQFYFLHCVRPNTEIDYERFDYKGMKFTSYYLSIEGKKIIEWGGYNSNPYAISRYEQASGEVYGRGPAMDVLPAVKTLNEQKKTLLKQGHRAVDPVLLVHDDGIIDTFSMKPGHMNAGGVSSEGRALVHTLPVGNVSVGKDMMDDERAVINDAFLVSLFQILTDTGTQTATEVMERAREKAILIAPVLGRQQTEYLGPMIDRELDILSRQGVLPPMPGILKEAKGEYTIQYESPLARSQQSESVSGFMRTLESALQIANVTQSMAPLYHFNFKAAIPEIAMIQGSPTKWMNTPDQVAALEDSEAQQQQAAQAQAAAPGQAALIKAAAVAQGR